ncbi:hypothetical protein [Litorilituus sediminis]|uniref:DUF1266 domain-containing protein n=1 Tax=Litorilituus sediminis TaxID=718192 RepID=A0A4P6P745_9GAMM|nr:hypothetical protein [Litorilituus sediminis]QBG36868.1 hypothetical protein EMK97_14625 [Litorilituus sediminis]
MPTEHQNLIVHVKKKAKQLQKSSPEKKHCQCLDEIAQEKGFRDYFDLKQKNKEQKQEIPLNPYFIDAHADIIKTVIANCAVEDELVPELWDLLFANISSDSDIQHIEQLTRCKIDKEAIKNYGYAALKSDSEQDKILGNILVSIGHYYRSLMDNSAHKIGEHINFKTYFGYWLLRFGQDKEVLEKLKRSYPYDGESGGTSWAPEWWLIDKGYVSKASA